jgi:aryl sulfotransferase
MTVAGAALAAVLAAASVLAYFVWYFSWEARRTRGTAYFGLRLDERRALKRRIRWYSLPARPIVRALGLFMRRSSSMPGFEFEGVAGPPKISSAEVFARASRYEPRPEDVFVATQMRCGTTWMQQIVFEVVHRGDGDLGDQGYRHLYAVSPWIEALNSVSIGDAPVVGDRRARIIKTHLPVTLCPYSQTARYIYVARHPVSCFASIADFQRSMAGPLVPPIDTLAAWFCSDRMYWRPWPDHVDGWWRWAETRDNVLFVHFEEMKRNLPGIVTRVATFLDCALTPDQHDRVVARSSFDYMKAHEESFEMAPPTMFSAGQGAFVTRGTTDRHEDVSPDVRGRILDYCRRQLRDRAYPAERFYPDLN